MTIEQRNKVWVTNRKAALQTLYDKLDRIEAFANMHKLDIEAMYDTLANDDFNTLFGSSVNGEIQ